MPEFDLIELVRRETAVARDDVAVGIGDDGAVLAPRAGHELVVATDTLVAGVHFPATTAAYDLGWKALAVNLSDLAAMGAEPAWATLALTLPLPDEAWVTQFARGFAALARAHGTSLVGGDTTRGPLTVSVTVHGFVPRGDALLRRGAHAGDAVFVTGTLGDAAGGLARPDVAALRERLDRPTPRVAAGRLLRGVASAAIDVSDGLLIDLGRLCDASGVGAEIDAEATPISAALRETFGDDAARAHAWSGGDDYELCFTAPADQALALRVALGRVALTQVGRVVATPGVRVLDLDGRDVTPARRGYEHFA